MLVRFAGLELGTVDGRVGEIGVSSIDFSYPEVRFSDSPREARDGVLPGRDYLGSRTMTIECWTNGSSMVEARRIAARVLGLWRRERERLNAGVSLPLEFQAVGDTRWRRVWGRPRRSDDPNFGVVMRQGKASFILEFEVLDPVSYAGGDGGLESVSIRVFEGSSGTGWVFPLRWPVRTEHVPERREGALQVGGELPTPAVVRFYGPGSGHSLDGSRGWHVGLAAGVVLAHDEHITIDPLAGTVRDNRGRNRFGDLDRRSRLTGIRLAPGVENVFFSANDPSHSAWARVQWREAFASLA